VLGCLQASTAVFHANVGWSYLPPAGEEKHMGSVVERLTHTAFYNLDSDRSVHPNEQAKFGKPCPKLCKITHTLP